MKLYLIGSLRNDKVPQLASRIRKDVQCDVFDDWYAAGPEADDYWKKYEVERGNSYAEALRGFAARHVFSFDKHHLDTSDAAVLMLPAGKSGHLELGYMCGRNKPTFILLDGEDSRFDVMYQFASQVCHSEEELIDALRKTAS